MQNCRTCKHYRRIELAVEDVTYCMVDSNGEFCCHKDRYEYWEESEESCENRLANRNW